MAVTFSGGGYAGVVITTTQPPPPVYMWSWGQNNYGQLGLSNTTYRSSPNQVGYVTTWSSLSGGRAHALAIKTDGTMWSWGRNSYGLGQLGLGDTTDRSSPVQIGALTTWSTIAAGDNHSMAIKTDGTMWSWGTNLYYGTLGLGDNTDRSSPTQIGALTTWSKIDAGGNFTLAIKTDGTLWSWGYNNLGQLGLGDITHRSSPVQVGALTTWSSVSANDNHSLAIKTDGTLWAWGRNYNGILGLGDTTHRSSPVQVGADTNWANIRDGTFHASAIKTDGTLWAWGRGQEGQLGQGNTTNRSSPVQIGALTTWLNITLGGGHTLATKTDGTLWSWGRNAYNGQLGLGDTTNRSSPVQIGALTTWLNIAAGAYHSMAIG